MKSSIKGGILTKKHLPNIITVSRMVFSAAMLFCPVFSPAFWAFYIAAGLSDMLDGAAARKLETVSKAGEKLDTFADFVFVAVCFIKVLPAVELPLWLLVWTGMIALIKFINVISGLAIRKELVTLHTVANKITGALLFALPARSQPSPRYRKGILLEQGENIE